MNGQETSFERGICVRVMLLGGERERACKLNGKVCEVECVR